MRHYENQPLYQCSVCQYTSYDYRRFRAFAGRVICNEAFCKAIVEIFNHHESSASTSRFTKLKKSEAEKRKVKTKAERTDIEQKEDVWTQLQFVLAKGKRSEREGHQRQTERLFSYRDTNQAHFVIDLMQSFVDNGLIWKTYNSHTHLEIRSHLRCLVIQFWCLERDKLLPLPESIVISGRHIELQNSVLPGGGSFANVHHAMYHQRDRRGRVRPKRVVLKVLRAPDNGRINISRDQYKLRRFFREVSIWRNLRHRNIVEMLGIIAHDDPDCETSPAMVLPKIAHGNVRDYMHSLSRNGGFYSVITRRTVHEWMCQIASAMEYLHSEDVVHGDLRGQNVLVDEDNVIKVTDFGLSVFASGIPGMQESSLPSDTQWQAPEFWDVRAGDLRQTREADIWSFGCVCVELYTNQDPYDFLLSDDWKGWRERHHLRSRAGARRAGEKYLVESHGHPIRPQFHRGELMVNVLWRLIESACFRRRYSERATAGELVKALNYYLPQLPS